MKSTADVVIVGAGVQGASLAFHLARRGVAVRVLERSSVGAGATGRSSGFVRMHYDLDADARLAWASFPYFEAWDAFVGDGDCSFVNTGFLQLVPPAMTDALRANVRMLRQIGVETHEVGPLEVAELVPGIATDDIVVGAYEPRSGYADPAGAAAGFLAAARRSGASFEGGRMVRSVLVEGERVRGVETDDGVVASPVVVNAAGPWAGGLARSVGLELPLQVWRHDTVYLGLPQGRDPHFPIVLDHARGVYFRPEGREQVLVGLETANELGGSPDRPFVPIVREVMDELITRLCARMPWMTETTLRTAHGGQDGMTPDQRPIIGPAGPVGHYLLCGFSGTGFKTAPAVGLGLSELIVDGATASVDLAPFTLERFGRGELLVGEHPYGDLWR